MIMSLKQKKIKFKPRIKLNHNICMIMKRQKANFLENITWSELGKHNIQAKKVYSKKTWVKHKSIKTCTKTAAHRHICFLYLARIKVEWDARAR